MKKIFDNIYKKKTVLVTGHTGFKGAWLTEWLLGLEANVIGISLEPNTDPSLFTQLDLENRITAHHIQDIRDYDRVSEIVQSVQPDFVFHLAAQPLVLLSYQEPLETYAINVMGTLHVLDALQSLHKPCGAVFITTDKCYDNKEWEYGYREVDALGGHDPYSSSKGCAELAISSFRDSFFAAGSPVAVASARAGNVIGGGDWAADRIVPDCMRALFRHEPIRIRNPIATRPWQHVLEPLSGYLRLAQLLYEESCNGTLEKGQKSRVRTSFNFGPRLESNKRVQKLVEEVLDNWPGEWKDCSDPGSRHEASLLNLVTDKAFHVLGWQPVWGFRETVQRTVEWYRSALTGDAKDIITLTHKQIDSYVQNAGRESLGWVDEG